MDILLVTLVPHGMATACMAKEAISVHNCLREKHTAKITWLLSVPLQH